MDYQSAMKEIDTVDSFVNIVSSGNHSTYSSRISVIDNSQKSATIKRIIYKETKISSNKMSGVISISDTYKIKRKISLSLIQHVWQFTSQGKVLPIISVWALNESLILHTNNQLYSYFKMLENSHFETKKFIGDICYGY